MNQQLIVTPVLDPEKHKKIEAARYLRFQEPSGKERVTAFEARLLAGIEIQNLLYEFDIFQVIYSEEYDDHDEYLSYAKEFITWLEWKNPTYGEVFDQVQRLFKGKGHFEPTDGDYHRLTGELVVVIYQRELNRFLSR